MNSRKKLAIFFFILVFCSCNGQENKIVQQNPGNESARLNDSAILIFAKSDGDPRLMNEALQLLEKAIQKDSLNANAFVNKANILCNLSNYTEAIHAINQSLSIKNVPEVKLMKGFMFDKMNRIDSAQAIYNEILDDYERVLKDSSNVKVELDRAILYFYLNKPGIAIQMFNELMNKYPNDKTVTGMKEFVEHFEKRKFIEVMCGGSAAN